MEISGNRIHIETDIHIWGIYCAVGALCALAAIAIYCASRNMKKGSASVLGLFTILCGAVFSRVIFCIYTTLTATRMPLAAWFQIHDGGWTMMGMIGGVLLAAWFSSKIISEKPARMLDAVSVALPLMMAAERLGEGRLDEMFNYNQFLSAGKLGKGFFTVADETGKYLIATYRVDAILCLILFLVLVFSMLSGKRKDGDLWVRFMTLAGAGCVLGENLRTDDFLVYSFVRIEQVLEALLLLGGVIAAGKRAGQKGRKLFVTAGIAMALTVAECIGIEFTVDRTQMSRMMMAGVMAAALSVPVVHVWFMQRLADRAEGNEKDTGKAVWTGLVISATETVFVIAEIIRTGTSLFPFACIVLFSIILILALHIVMLLKTGWRTILKLNRPSKEN